MTLTTLRQIACRAAARAGCVLAATFGLALPAWADYPDRPITWVVGFPPGGGTDFMARTIAARLAQNIGQPVLIENRPGAGGNVAAESVARRAADGYVIMSAERTLLTYSKSLFQKLSFDPYADFKPVSLMTRAPFLFVVRDDHPARTLQEFIAATRAKPGSVSYATPGPGTPHHIATEAFAQASGLQMLHVPYRGAAPALTDLMGGQVDAMVLDLQLAQPVLRGGKLRALAVMAPQRLEQEEWRHIPAVAEAGVDMVDATTWQGVVVPAGTPDAVVARLSEELRRAIDADDVRTALTEAGLLPTPSTPEGMADTIRRDAGAWRERVSQLQLTLD